MVPGSMIAPAYLSEFAQVIFGKIAQTLEGQRRASPHYVEIVALLAQRLEQIQRWQAVVEVQGDTYDAKTATGELIVRKRPEVQMLSDAMRHAHALLAELMITPSTAMRLSGGQKSEENPFAELMKL